jgi:microcystin-dependent protein
MKMILAAAMLAGGMAFTVDTADAQEKYMAEVFVTAANFCPRGTLAANGQLLPVSQYNAVFSLVGTVYGGDGRTTFGLPDLRGRAPISAGSGPGLSDYRLGSRQGREYTALSILNLPAHSHTGHVVAGTAAPDASTPVGHALADYTVPGVNAYTATGPAEAMAPGTVQTDNTGAGQEFVTLSPSLTMQYCFVMEGLYPSRS